MYKQHVYHLVSESPWPFFCSINALFVPICAVMYFQNFSIAGFSLIFALIFLICSMSLWWRDIIREGTFLGDHTLRVQKGLRYGMVLFIVSEVMFFFAFFWAFFNASLVPSIGSGLVWPPRGIQLFIFNAADIPLVNTAFLLLSGVSITWAHHSIISGFKLESLIALIITLILAVTFTGLQVFEYTSSLFSIASGVYGSTFFMATGFHGLHVLIGSTFLCVCLGRLMKDHFTQAHHYGFEAAAWYWHFVDVVWLFLFISIYWWGSLGIMNEVHQYILWYSSGYVYNAEIDKLVVEVLTS